MEQLNFQLFKLAYCFSELEQLENLVSHFFFPMKHYGGFMGLIGKDSSDIL
jgi:hypothetical protein